MTFLMEWQTSLLEAGDGSCASHASVVHNCDAVLMLTALVSSEGQVVGHGLVAPRVWAGMWCILVHSTAC